MDRVGSLKIGELLTKPVTISPSAPVSKVIGLLRENKAYEAFVTEQKEVQGIVTIRDILRAKHIATGKISSLMTRIPRLKPEDDVSLAARIMTEHRIRAVPVAEEGKLIGQLTAASICGLRAYPKSPAARNVIHAHAKCSMAR